MNILLISNCSFGQRWQHELVARLEAIGHRIFVRHAPARRPVGLERILAFESMRFPASLATPDVPLRPTGEATADLAVDLTGVSTGVAAPTLTVELAGQPSLDAGLPSLLAEHGEVELVMRLDGVPVAAARPMINDRLWLSRAASDLLAGAIGAIESCVARFAAGELQALAGGAAAPRQRGDGLAWRYATHLTRGLVRRGLRKLSRRPFYWQTAYRLVEEGGVAEHGRLSGPAFTVIPDDGRRFYADPFAFEWQGEQYLFLEEYRYATGKGVISVARLEGDGKVGTPLVVLEEPHHLSYPQVFERDGEVYMIPESSAARELVLYRAARFPDRWERQAVLVADADLNDMTLVEHDGRLWLIGTERRAGGSASDTMVVYTAEQLDGPWRPHRLNPILIDRSAARPGGHVVVRGGRLLLPVQDGADTYGGGLGLAELQVLSEAEVRFGPVQPIGPGEAWDRRGIHTLTRAGRLEAVDSCR